MTIDCRLSGDINDLAVLHEADSRGIAGHLLDPRDLPLAIDEPARA